MAREINRKAQEPQDLPYPNSPIAEALCEIHFEPMTDRRNNLEWIEAFHKKTATSYTERENKQLVDYRAEISSGGVTLAPATDHPIQRTILRHADQSHIVQLSPGLMAVNETAKYPGWKIFKGHIQDNWERIVVIGEPKRITRIGLRYINRIQRNTDEEQTNTWLAESGYVPPLLLNCKTNFMSRFEHRLDNGRRLIITVAEEASNAQPKPIIFDIDSIKEVTFTTDWKTIEPTLDQLHQDVWDAFRSTASKKLVDRMEGRRDGA